MKMTKQKLFSPFLFFLLMLIDGQITRFLLAASQDQYIWRAHLTLLTMLFAARYLPKYYLILVALVTGSLFDLYFIGLLGIYAVAFPLVIWLVYLLHGTLYENYFNLFFGFVILLTVFEVVIVVIQLLFNLITVDPTYFITRLLGPSLLLNMLFLIIGFYPLKKIYWKN